MWRSGNKRSILNFAMYILEFIKLNLQIGDFIWLMNEKGEGFTGNYAGSFNESNQTFQFNNHSNGKTQTIEIQKLQRLVINQRARQ